MSSYENITLFAQTLAVAKRTSQETLQKDALADAARLGAQIDLSNLSVLRQVIGAATHGALFCP